MLETFEEKKLVEQKSISEIERVFALQKENRWTMARQNAKQRVERLERLKRAILDQQKNLEKALKEDLGRPGVEALMELYPVIHDINHTIRHLKGWMKPQKVGTPLTLFGAKSYVQHEAKGVVLVIAPWNYPFNLLFGPLVGAMAAGNTVIIKPSELAPATSRFAAKLIRETFKENEVAIFEGGVEVAHELLKLPFDHILYTGGSRVARIVMEAAAKNLTPVTLELGGKSPVIIDDRFDLNVAAERIGWGKCLNAGQTCVAPDYVLIPDGRVRDFCQILQSKISLFYGPTEESRRNSKDFGRIINVEHFRRIKALVEETVKMGARLECGGVFDEKNLYIAPTVLLNVKPNMPIMKEEIFGPVLPVLGYRSRHEAIQLINRGEKPLALYIFSDNRKIQEEILQNTSAGGTAINDTVVHLANPNLPFGGVGESGMGNYHGIYGFKTFSHERAVLHQALWTAKAVFNPPYTQRVKDLLNWITRWLT